MFRAVVRPGWQDESGAVAATYAIALFGLVAIAGVAFDYARLVSLDSEMQNAADQAALAGATQLDGKVAAGSVPGACARAAAAASGLLTNKTVMGNVGSSNLITVPNEAACDAVGNIQFYQDRDGATAATSDANARFIRIGLGLRTAKYVLTPVVGAFSGSVSAAAMAGIGSAICRSPPVMMCNPEEPAGNTVVERDFNADNYKGIGIRLIQNDAYTPGSFGFLDTDYGNGASNLLAAIGWNTPPGECVDAAGVEINNGVKTSVRDGFNARFDVPGSGQVCPTIDGVAGVCHPSVNVRKDLVRPANNCNWDTNDANSGNFATRNYRPTTAAVYPSGTTPDIMGHPRDLCHAWGDVGNCNGVNGGKGERIGTGDWDIQAYWRSNYSGAAYTNQVSATTYGSQPKGYPTRYQVYRYELDNISTINTPKAGAGSSSAYSVPQSGSCLASSASPYGVLPSTAGYDRRKLTIAVLNCNALSALHGSLNGKVLAVGSQNWADVFLVEPAFPRDKCKGGSGCNTKYSDQKDVYVEVVGRTNLAGGGETGQTVRKDVPYLVK